MLGVPQGSVLGPALFLVYINTLPDGLSSTPRLFADDCLLYRQIESQDDQQIIQKDLEELENWASTWGMRFNIQCHEMLCDEYTQKPTTTNKILRHPK